MLDHVPTCFGKPQDKSKLWGWQLGPCMTCTPHSSAFPLLSPFLMATLNPPPNRPAPGLCTCCSPPLGPQDGDTMPLPMAGYTGDSGSPTAHSLAGQSTARMYTLLPGSLMAPQEDSALGESFSPEGKGPGDQNSQGLNPAMTLRFPHRHSLVCQEPYWQSQRLPPSSQSPFIQPSVGEPGRGRNSRPLCLAPRNQSRKHQPCPISQCLLGLCAHGQKR